MLMAVSAHAVGWPIPRGGSQSLTNALCGYLSTFGGKVKTSSRVESLAALSHYDLILCDVTPRQLLRIAGQRYRTATNVSWSGFVTAPAYFKVDYALTQPIPWKASECLRAATVHLGGSFEEIAAVGKGDANGATRGVDRSFCSPSRVCLIPRALLPRKHMAWAYCHVPNGSKVDMLGEAGRSD